jgi:hypothetical protein
VSAAATFRGQPLLVLAGLLGAWLALRVAFWQPSADAALLSVPNLAVVPAQLDRAAAAVGDIPFLAVVNHPSERVARVRGPNAARASWPVRPNPPARLAPPLRAAFVANRRGEGEAGRAGAVRAAIGHTLLLAAGLAQMPLPATLAAYLQDAAPVRPGVPAAAPLLASLPQHAPPFTGSRWSADAWLMLRQDTTASVASGRPSYGRSQAGAVLRYRLAPASTHAPQAYVRASSALGGPLERDLVAGLSGRPLPRVPLRVALEARVSETEQGTELRPAVIAVTELAPLRLPRGLRAEAYLQGGYVGGRFATGFVDGQGRVERAVARIGEADVSAGAGAWGGAQKGAARLDIGPTAAVSFRLGEARGRLAADYRFRVAGAAEPRSGPALTLSAGF